MPTATVDISIKGKLLELPAVQINGRQIVISGKWLKMALIKDEEWIDEPVAKNPALFVTELQRSGTKADIFVFSQRLDDLIPKYPFHLEWDNCAAISTTIFADWWEKLPQVTRKNVRRAAKRGVVAKSAPFDDDLVHGITRIYNETPIRQGRRFWHYGKDFDTVKRDNSSYLSQSDFVVAYFEQEIIGFIKIVFVGKVARIMQIVSMNKHFDKRPMNALIAKSVELCCQKNASHFVYGKYVYGNKTESPITEFKRRNGFDQLQIPTYFIPLTPKGRLAIALKLHLGLQKIIPNKLMAVLLNTRSKLYQQRFFRGKATESAIDAESR